MDFRTEINLPPSGTRIDHRTGMLFMGSCFTENIGERMQELCFDIDINPFGINYNPSSVSRSLWSILQGKLFKAEDLEYGGEKWFSFDHHGHFSDPDQERCLYRINERIQHAHHRLKDTNVLILTWGTAWVYVHKESARVVSNCHKLPARQFSRHLLSINQIVDTYTKLFPSLRAAMPELKIILTVSPVRHWKDGPQLNSVSKSTLIMAVHRLCEMFSFCEYFPAYELAMDDLRDYRFYGPDLLHPNEQMIQYIWEKFSGTFMDPPTLDLCRKVRKLRSAMTHLPFHPESSEYRLFASKQLKAAKKLSGEHPELKLSPIIEYFSGGNRKNNI